MLTTSTTSRRPRRVACQRLQRLGLSGARCSLRPSRSSRWHAVPFCSLFFSAEMEKNVLVHWRQWMLVRVVQLRLTILTTSQNSLSTFSDLAGWISAALLDTLIFNAHRVCAIILLRCVIIYNIHYTFSSAGGWRKGLPVSPMLFVIICHTLRCDEIFALATLSRPNFQCPAGSGCVLGWTCGCDGCYGCCYDFACRCQAASRSWHQFCHVLQMSSVLQYYVLIVFYFMATGNQLAMIGIEVGSSQHVWHRNGPGQDWTSHDLLHSFCRIFEVFPRPRARNCWAKNCGLGLKRNYSAQYGFIFHLISSSLPSQVIVWRRRRHQTSSQRICFCQAGPSAWRNDRG